MALIVILDLLVVGALLASALLRGFERTLPLAAFLLIVFPNESQIPTPGFDLTTQRVIVIVLIALYVFTGEARAKRTLPLMILVPLLMVWMLLSTANSIVFAISLKTVLSQFFDFFVIYYIFAKSITTVETVQKIVSAFVVAMMVCSVFGLLELYWGWSVIGLFPAVHHRFEFLESTLDRGVRVQSSFGHPILFGATLATAIPLALYLATTAKTKAWKIILWSSILLMFMNIYKTGSRGPWLALVLSLGVLGIFAEVRLRKYLAVFGLLTITVLVVRPGVWQSLANLAGETLNPDTSQGVSYQWRYALLDIAFDHLGRDFGRALWGYGPESFASLNWYGEFQGQTVLFDSCDSSVAALMIETGYVGLLIVAALFLRVAFVAFQGYRKLPRPASSLCLSLFVNICAFAFMTTNVLILGWGQQNYWLWIVFAISMVYPTLAFNEETAPADPMPQFRMANVPSA